MRLKKPLQGKRGEQAEGVKVRESLPEGWVEGVGGGRMHTEMRNNITKHQKNKQLIKRMFLVQPGNEQGIGRISRPDRQVMTAAPEGNKTAFSVCPDSGGSGGIRRGVYPSFAKDEVRGKLGKAGSKKGKLRVGRVMGMNGS